AMDMARCRAAALALYERLRDDPESLTLPPPELDIVVWAPAAGSLEAVSARSRAVFDACARRDLHLALIELPAAGVEPCWPAVRRDADAVVCLRSCLMKPEHSDWIGPIADRYGEALAECGA
ncbi:MAG: aspartate aminotransferase family protein, partial [Pseudomonadota bacterium]